MLEKQNCIENLEDSGTYVATCSKCKNKQKDM